MIKIKSNDIFKSKVFKRESKSYFNNVFIKIFKKYRLYPAKGGRAFEHKIKKGEINALDLPDMSYPMHILNGIIPSLKVLENMWIDRELINKDNEDNDIKMLLKCLLIAFTFHDINKLHNEIDLKIAVEKYFKDDLKDLEIELNEEEKEIIKYLILATEERTRFTISDEKLPERRGIDRLIKDDLIEIIHLADSISIPINEYGDLLKIWKKLKEYVDVNIIYFDETPYEVLVRFVIEILRETMDCYVISPRGFIYKGNLKIDEKIKEIVKAIENVIIKYSSELITIDNQKAQLDVFRFVSPTKENIENLINELISKEENHRKFLISKLPTDKEIRDEIIKKFEDLVLNREKLERFVLLKMILLISKKGASKELLKLKENLRKKYIPKHKGAITYQILIEKANEQIPKDELGTDLILLITERYRNEKINLEEIILELLQYSNLRKNINLNYEIGSKKDICALCGKKATTTATENLCFGFSSQGFTNRVVVSLKNEKKYICSLCLVEIILRKLIFGKNHKKKEIGELKAVYIDAYDYFVPILDEKLTKYVEEISENLGNFLKKDIDGYKNSIVYGFGVKSEEELTPFLMGFVNISNQIDFIRFYNNILKFVYNTDFKIYLTYPFNPDRIKKYTITFDYAPKSFKKLKWDGVRIDEIENVKKEFDLLWRLGYTLKGSSKSANIVVSLINDYADNPLAFFYYLFKLDHPTSFINRGGIELNPVLKRIGGEKMNILEKLANIASEIEWSRKSASSKTSMIRESLEVLKTGVKKGYSKENIKSLMAGMLYRKYPYSSKKELIEKFCDILYDELFEGIWNGKIPSKKEQRYWTYGFGLYYTTKSDEKRNEYYSKNEN
ncbi:hypothetical protein [Methanothermococcus okinawensis]|uniref:CRISPR-associated protein Csc3 n=1 Tax=Methanothermococcus okinawensis (strain DSM 14208 / JCM 11175 / IH1) TaxID=647113 RepID=F8AMZ2_METOI|nr:hypothetical protein [Methanothermococcus okinawensis]AEH06115.1 hypothetical protein Metok_0119 [Methanothermococcus okinawensis IH1]